MLKLFEVEGFRNFREPIILDFSEVRDYKFNSDCLSNGLISKAVIYGKNAIGKSNFGVALFDITSLVWRGGLRRYGDDDISDVSYLNTGNQKGYAAFRYVFQFDGRQVEYSYRKNAEQALIYEKVMMDDELLFEVNRTGEGITEIERLRKLSPTLNMEFAGVDSVFHYVVTNTPLRPDHPLQRVLDFVGHMQINRRHERSINTILRGWMPRILTDEDVLREFEVFLHDAGVQDGLITISDAAGRESLYFDTKPPLSFGQVASSGTKMLLDLFIHCKMAETGRVSLLFLDEFDAFYHFELAESIVRALKRLKDTQVIFTSHNTNLLSNRIMRPDCFFIMTENKLTSFANATERELREGHNLSKLFMSGEFDG